MGGITRLSKIQLCLETTPGTAVPATTIWRGRGTLTDARVLAAVEENIGQIFPKPRQYTQYIQGTVALDAVEATFEQLPYLLAMGIDDVVSGSKDGSGSGYAYVYAMSLSAVQAGKTYTLEVGDNQDVDQLSYVFCQEIKLAGASRGGLMMSATLVGRMAENPSTTFTGSLSVPTVEEIVFSKGALYLDATGGTIGTTLKSTTLLGVELTVNTGKTPLQTADGVLSFGGIRDVGPTVTGTLTLEHNDTGEAERKVARTHAVRLLRLLWQGSALATPGTNYTYKTVQFDAAIQYTGVPVIGDRDGDRIVDLPFRVVDSDSIVPTITVVNELSALP